MIISAQAPKTLADIDKIVTESRIPTEPVVIELGGPSGAVPELTQIASIKLNAQLSLWATPAAIILPEHIEQVRLRSCRACVLSLLLRCCCRQPSPTHRKTA